ncbi:MAG: PIN domain-containing protein [Spirosomaceae bacterium]|jgi:predicted nucleic acid-binding protein|nr:PIN domain-containing protein [Spirosomataceae bacterium]
MNTAVVDSNIVLAALRKKDSITRQKILRAPFRFITTTFLFVEIFKYKERIFERAVMTEEEIYEYLAEILQRIDFISEELISTESFFTAYHLCKDIDKKDIPFVAFSIEFNIPLWTRDDKLKDHLKIKGFNNFFDENLL